MTHMAHCTDTKHTAHAPSALPFIPEVDVPEVAECACVHDDDVETMVGWTIFSMP